MRSEITAGEIVTALRNRGCRLKLTDNGELRVGPAHLVSAAARELLASQKPAIVEHLRREHEHIDRLARADADGQEGGGSDGGALAGEPAPFGELQDQDGADAVTYLKNKLHLEPILRDGELFLLFRFRDEKVKRRLTMTEREIIDETLDALIRHLRTGSERDES